VGGPFTEAKEMICGFAVLNATSKEDLLKMTESFLRLAGDGTCELRQILEPDQDPSQL
jgi:hypothetical protein